MYRDIRSRPGRWIVWRAIRRPRRLWIVRRSVGGGIIRGWRLSCGTGVVVQVRHTKRGDDDPDDCADPTAADRHRRWRWPAALSARARADDAGAAVGHRVNFLLPWRCVLHNLILLPLLR